jgi:hypothetical protein
MLTYPKAKAMDEYRTLVATNKIWESFGIDLALMELVARTAAVDEYKSIQRLKR